VLLPRADAASEECPAYSAAIVIADLTLAMRSKGSDCFGLDDLVPKQQS
jgi:hypothetical protein